VRILGAEDRDLAANRADFLAANDLVVFLHRERIVEVHVLRPPLAFVLDGDHAPVRRILSVCVVRLDHGAGCRREHLVVGADVRVATEPEEIEAVLIGGMAVIGGCTPRRTALERQLECWFHDHTILLLRQVPSDFQAQDGLRRLRQGTRCDFSAEL